MPIRRTVITPEADADTGRWLPRHLVAFLVEHRGLVAQMARRQADARFRGSYLGWLLALVNPLLLLGVYTLAFTVLMQIGDSADRLGFALRLFSSMIVFAVFSDTVCRAPTLVTGNPNYVKKVVFPLEVLAVADLLASAMVAIGSLVILLVALACTGHLSVTAVAFPLVLPPLACVTLGCAWIVASLGVYARDVASVIGVAVTMLFYLTPVLYELDAVPVAWRWLAEANPLASVVESARRTLVLGRWPDWAGLSVSWLVGAVLAWLGFAWFRIGKRGFADVL